MKHLIINLILSLSPEYGIDPKVAMSIATVESNISHNAVGSAGELGAFQLLPSAFPKMTKHQLLDPKNHVRTALKHLKFMKDQCHHCDDYTWVVAYNTGLRGSTRIQYPKKFKYYKKFIKTFTNMEDMVCLL